MGALDLWYTRLSPEVLFDLIKDRAVRKNIEKRVNKRVAKETARSALEHDFPKLAKATGEQIAL